MQDVDLLLLGHLGGTTPLFLVTMFYKGRTNVKRCWPTEL